MIKKAQIKFIAIIMSILLFVFLVLFGVYYFIIKNVNERSIEKSLMDVKAEITRPNAPAEYIPEDGMIAIFYPHVDLSMIDIRFDNKTFTKEMVDNIINSIKLKDAPSGSIGNVYYKFISSGDRIIFIALDQTELMNSFSNSVLNSASALIIVFVVLFFVAWRLSFFVFRPIRESFYKQREFISNASHELKTPLTIISANADVVKAMENNPYVDSIKTQTDRMSVLVEDMLTLAKMDERSKPLNAITFNISDEIVSDTLAFDAVAFEKGKTLDTDIEPDIFYKGDFHSVKNIVNILMDNAVKHAVQGGNILVSLKKENNKIIFTVFNTGSSVPDQDSSKIFERFYRPDNSRSRESGGSGLGLAIAKSIADSNKWRISAQSKFGVSMTITVVFS